MKYMFVAAVGIFLGAYGAIVSFTSGNTNAGWWAVSSTLWAFAYMLATSERQDGNSR